MPSAMQDRASDYQPATSSRHEFRAATRPYIVEGCPAHSLSAVEQCVVALSLFDPLPRVAPPSKVMSILSWIWGAATPGELADARLEALRRYCILFREIGGAVPADEVDRIRAADFSSKALAEARDLIARGVRQR